MKVVQINACSFGSTGKIMFSIHKELLNNDFDSYVIWSEGRKPINYREIKIENPVGVFYHKIYSRIFGKQGFASWKATKKIIRKLDEIKPDIVHLHNLHSNYINLELLINYLKTKKIKVFWTFHDCWAFTGKCVHFELAKCMKWKNECYDCPVLKESPIAYVDKSKWCFNKKRVLLSNLDLTIVTPSLWLAKYVKDSFLNKHSVYVINNGIDINLFKEIKTNIRKKMNLEEKIVILGIASTWDKRKGLSDFIELSKILDDNYRIILIGLTQKQINGLPNNIIGITRTENQKELVELYNAADLVFNPTYEDTYPTINLESIACGTPVLTYDTGGSPEFTEFISNDIERYIIKKEFLKKDKTVIKEYIDYIIDNGKIKIKDRNMLSEATMVEKYINLYKKI